MFDQGTIARPFHLDKRSPALSVPGHFEFFRTQDQQTFAASNALCALGHNQQSVLFEPELPNHQNDGIYHAPQMPSSVGSLENMAWNGRPTWMESTVVSAAPDEAGSLTFSTTGQLENGGPCTHYPILPLYPSQEYNVSAPASFHVIDYTPTSGPTQQHTPPFDTYLETFSDHSAPPPPTELASRSSAGPGTKSEYEDINDCIAMTGHVNNAEEVMSDIPYANLIERALLEAEGNRLVLKDIYKWIEENTDKAGNPAFKGWQNSVRHNLSMNGAFTKIPLPRSENKSQKGYMWMLEPSAKEHGIQSTTRYRRKDETKRIGKRFAVNVHRQRSGRRGGCASQKATKLRRAPFMCGESQSPQNIKGDGPSALDAFDLTSRDQQRSVRQLSASAGHYQPHFPSQPSQSPFSDNGCYNYAESYNCIPLDSALPLAPHSINHSSPTSSPTLMSRAADRPTGDHSGSDF